MVFVAVLIVFSAAALWQSYGIAGFSKWSSPGVFPMLASATMLICAIVIFRDHYKQRYDKLVSSRPAEASASVDDPPDTPGNDSEPLLPARVIVLTLLLVLYIVGMPSLGFLLSSGLFLFASISYLWEKPVWQALLISVLALVVIHVIFRLVFQVILPQGTFIDWLA